MKIFLQILKDRDGGAALGLFVGKAILGAIGTSLVGKLFGGDDKKTPATVLAPDPVITDPGTEPRQAQDRARRRRASVVGRKATILTSPLGLAGDEDIARPSLLGR